MQKIIGCLLSFSVYYRFSLYANPAVDTLDKQLANTQQLFQAHFVQANSKAHNLVIQITEGEMALERPGKFLWQINKPDQQLLVSDGKQLWIYDKDLEQVIIQPVNQRLDETPALLLAGEVESIQRIF